MKNTSQLILGFGVMILLLLPGIGNANPDSVGSFAVTDDILRSRTAFDLVDAEIASRLNLGALSEWDYQKLRGPVLLKIRTAIHFQLRQQFGRIVNTVDFNLQQDLGSPSQSPSINENNRPSHLHKRAAEMIRDFIVQNRISVIIMSDAPIGLGEAAAVRGLQGEVRYTYDIINGACVAVPIGNLTALINRPFVAEIWPDAKANVALINLAQIGAIKVYGKRPTGLGVMGKGVNVAVVDGGIDSDHPEFKGRLKDTRGVLVFGGFDIFKDEIDHGTHVAGIIGAALDNNVFTGVAPKVNLLDAQVDLDEDTDRFTLLGQNSYGDTMDAIKWAARKHTLLKANVKADVINMSLGWRVWEYGRNANDPMSVLIDEVVNDGVVFVVAAGNEAQERSADEISTHAKPNKHPFEVYIKETGKVWVTVTLMWDTDGNDLDLAIFDTNGSEVFASRSSAVQNGKTYAKKSIYGTSKFYEQVGFLLENKSTSHELFNADLQVEASSVQNSQEYEVWVSAAGDGGSSLKPADSSETIGVPGYTEKAITVGAVNSGNQITHFSSWGSSDTNLIASHTDSIKPEIVAPGSNIASTVSSPQYYGEKSGTSMAAPHVAGVAALILDAVGKNSSGEWNFSPVEVKSAIILGAKRLSNRPDNTYGAGLVRADNTIFGETIAPEETLRFEITPRLTDLSYDDYDLDVDPSIKVAVSWEETADNLDVMLSDESGKTLLESKQTASNYEKIDGSSVSVQNATYYLDVHNRSQKSITFTGAATHPIKASTAIADVLVTEAPDDATQPLPIGHSDVPLSTNSTQEARLRAILKRHTDFVSSVAFSPDGRTLASGSWDDTIRLWNPRTEEHLATLNGHTDRVTSVAFSPNGNMLASGSWDKTVRFWKPHTGKTLATTYSLYTTNETFTSVVAADADRDSYWFASGSLDNDVWLWYGYGLTSYTKKWDLSGHTHDVSSVAFSADERTLASGSHDNTVKLWYVSSRKLRANLKGHTDFVTSVAFSPDERTLASGSWDNTIRLWDVATGKSTKTLKGHTDRVLAVAFSPDGRTLASGSDDQTIRLWDVATGQQREALLGHTSGVTAVAFSPDRRLLASAGGWDNTVRLWDLSTAPTPAPTVSIAPSPVISPTVGENMVVKVDIAGVQDVAGYQATVHFDPSALRYVESANGTYLPTASLFVSPVVNANQVTLAATSLSGDSDGAGTLATLTFEVVAVKPSQITLSDVMIMKQNLTSIPIIVIVKLKNNLTFSDIYVILM
ncbi:S8 family serine peptidase, partial [Candidatus Poribacteria bacterium]|nr:S8 family serine peptidase [Candidatus Poribacteria bacterium]